MFTAATNIGGDAQRRLLCHCADAGELGTATGAQHRYSDTEATQCREKTFDVPIENYAL